MEVKNRLSESVFGKKGLEMVVQDFGEVRRQQVQDLRARTGGLHGEDT
jgi:hypothetical protein